MLAVTLLAANTAVFSEAPRHFFLMGADAAWLSAAMGSLMATIALLVIGLALENLPGQGLYQMARASLGKIVGSTYILMLISYFTFTTAFVTRLLSEAIIITALPNIPISLAVFCIIAFVTYATYRGLNALAKSCYIALPFIAAGVFTLLFTSSGNWNFQLLQPWLGFGFYKTVLGGTLTAGVVGDAIVLAVLADTMQTGISRLRLATMAMLITAVLQISMMLVISMVFPYPVGSELTLPYYMLSRSITLGMFLQRLESLFLVSWALAVMLKIAIVFTCGLYLFRKLFSIKDSAPLVIPYAGITFALAFLPKNYMATAAFTWQWLRLYGSIVTLAIPVLMALISIIKARQAAAKQVESA